MLFTGTLELVLDIGLVVRNEIDKEVSILT
jgi:hypothetical protein